MVNSRHYYRGIQVQEPVNWQDLEVTMDWVKGKIDATINLDTLEFKGETAQKIITDLATGGYFEGRPYRVEVGEPLNPALTFEGYLDPADAPIIKDCNIIQIPLKRKQGEDWLVERADGVVFRYLASNQYNGAGKITNSDYVGVPYVINFIPDGVELLILAISTFSLTKELIDSIKDLTKQTQELIAGVTPVVGTGTGFGVVAVTAFDIGDIIASIVGIAIQLAYTIGIIVGIVKLVEQIIEQLAPVKRFHLGMPVRLLVQRGLQSLGLELKSTILDSIDTGSNKWVIIPSKSHKGGSPPTGTPIGEFTELGVPNASDGIDNLGQLITVLKTTFNADYQIKDGVFEFERKDFWKNKASYTIPNTFNNQEALRNEYTLNTDELKSNYLIVWDTDAQDQNTLDNQSGRTYQAITSPIAVQDPDLVLTKGLETVNVPFSMAVRKDTLTAVEEVLKVFLQAADFLSGTLGSPNSFAAQFSARVGSMHLSSHFLTRPKMVVMAGSSLALDQRSILSAQKLWERFHFIESFVTIDDINNQQKIFKEQKIPFCFADLVSLLNNNFANLETGQDAEIMNLVYSVEKNSATVTYRVYEVYDNNLKIEFLDK
jgi:hypothetical protein